jgi:LysM repeat protein
VVGTVTIGQETPMAEVPTAAPPTGGSEVQPTAVPQVAAATATRAPLPTPTPGKPSSWTLQTGEFPYCIARRFNVNPSELLRLNGLSTDSLVFAGMTLKIPQTGDTFPGSRSLKSRPTNYTVAAGDNIYSIACQFGDADPYAIAAANGLTSPYRLNAGQSLYIP